MVGIPPDKVLVRRGFGSSKRTELMRFVILAEERTKLLEGEGGVRRDLNSREVGDRKKRVRIENVGFDKSLK